MPLSVHTLKQYVRMHSHKEVLYVTIEFVSKKQILPSLNFSEGYYAKLLSERSVQFQERIIS